MKILKILRSDDEGGVLQAEIQYMKELRHQGVVINSIIVGEGRNKELYKSLSDFAIFIPRTNLSIKGSPIKKIKSIFRLKRWAKVSVETIPNEIINQTYAGIFFGRIGFMFLSHYLSKKNGAKSYYFMHSVIRDKKSLPIYKYLFRKLGITLIANSIFTQKSFNGFCKHYFYPGYDSTRTAQYHKGKTFRDELNIGNNTLVFGIAGRICDFKAQNWITEILMQEKFKEKDFVLLLAGIEQDRSMLEKIKAIAAADFGKKIIYLGNLSEMSKFYASIDVLINSGKGPESFGISVIEACASRLPIIASNVGGTAETVQDNYNGWTFNDFTIDSYDEVISRVFKEKEKIKEYGENSLKKAEGFSAKVNVESLIQLLNG